MGMASVSGADFRKSSTELLVRTDGTSRFYDGAAKSADLSNEIEERGTCTGCEKWSEQTELPGGPAGAESQIRSFPTVVPLSGTGEALAKTSDKQLYFHVQMYRRPIDAAIWGRNVWRKNHTTQSFFASNLTSTGPVYKKLENWYFAPNCSSGTDDRRAAF